MERSEPLLSPAKLNFALLRPLGFGFKEEIEKLPNGMKADRAR
jgi:hypothetical protein